MHNKEMDLIFESWRTNKNYPPITQLPNGKLEEGLWDKIKRGAMLAPFALMGTQNPSMPQQQATQDTIEDVEMSELDKYNKEMQQKGSDIWNKDMKSLTDKNKDPDAIIKKGMYKGQYNPKVVMKKAIDRHQNDFYKLPNGYVYIHPGSIDGDEVLPSTGLTADQYKDYLMGNKEILGLHKMTYGDPSKWSYVEPGGNTDFIYSMEAGGNVLPLDWSVTYDSLTTKIYNFLDDLAENGYTIYEEADGPVMKTEEELKPIFKRHYMGTESERQEILNFFQLSQGEDFKIGEYLQERANDFHNPQPTNDTGLQEIKNWRTRWTRLLRS